MKNWMTRSPRVAEVTASCVRPARTALSVRFPEQAMAGQDRSETADIWTECGQEEAVEYFLHGSLSIGTVS
jgi:hypothetical protein